MTITGAEFVSISTTWNKSDTYQVPALTRAKAPSDKDRHGTEIIITKLDKERARYLRSAGGLRVTRQPT